MVYDQNSFLQGIAIGRSMKGVEVIAGGGGAGNVKVQDSTLEYVPIISVGVTVPETSSIGSLNLRSYISIETQHTRSSSPAVPAGIGLSGITASVSAAYLTEYQHSPGTPPPDNMGYSITLGAAISIDEEE